MKLILIFACSLFAMPTLAHSATAAQVFQTSAGPVTITPLNHASTLIEAGLHLKRRPNGDPALWQRRFWEHTIRDESDFARHVDYVHFNPVKHGLAARVRDWSFSSFHRYVREGILPEDWAGDVRESGADYGEPIG